MRNKGRKYDNLLCSSQCKIFFEGDGVCCRRFYIQVTDSTIFFLGRAQPLLNFMKKYLKYDARVLGKHLRASNHFISYLIRKTKI